MKRTALFLTMLSSLALCAPDAVRESARSVPVAYDVDVVVVGGTVGAVAAASACAKAGAKVFLAAPRPYLGEDLAAPLRLWLEPGEEPQTPLAKRIFSPDASVTQEPGMSSLPFTYKASKKSGPPHPDNREQSILRDSRYDTASGASVQYEGPVSVTADLGQKTPFVREAIAFVYHRSDYSLASIDLELSVDGKTWDSVGTVKNEAQPQAGPQSSGMPIHFKVERKIRYARFGFTNAPESTRVLLGELVFTQPPAEEPALTKRRRTVRPLHLKQTLDDELLQANVSFLFSSYPTDVIRDAKGQLAGVVIANRGGRQAVLAKVVIDATQRAAVARMAGVKIPSWPAGLQRFKRVVIGGQPHPKEGVATVETIAPAPTFKGKRYPFYEYDLTLDLKADTPAAWAEIEQEARDLTYDPGQQFTSDVLWAVPPVCIKGAGPDLSVCRPESVDRLYVLGPMAGVSREAAAQWMRPDPAIAIGTKIGITAASMAARLEKGANPRVAGDSERKLAENLDIREILGGVRPGKTYPQIPSQEASLPILGQYDVVVVGGGTSGAPAAIGAARNGAKTLLIEYLHGLGGVGTMGAISKYYHGYRGGFTKEVPEGSSWAIESRMEWWRKEVRKPGGEIWFGTLGCGSVCEGDRVRGVVVAGPFGRGVVLAKTVIDSTGNADIAAAAGAECVYTDGTDIAVQGTGLPPRELGASYRNTDFTITDETDMVDVTSLFVYAKRKYSRTSFDQGRLIDTRERRRIVGEVTLNIPDMVTGRTYPDSIVKSQTNYDTHGYTVDPYLAMQMLSKRKSVTTWTPYRALLPKGLRGILVTGLGISVHRDSVPLIRMQPDLQNQGYAVGTAAAMVRDLGGEPRKVDMAKLQKHLVAKGILPETMIGAKDTFPLPDRDYEKAAAALASKPENLGLLMTDPKRSAPHLRKALAAATAPEARLRIAQTLAMIGDPTGIEEVIQAVRKAETWDKGWNYRAMGQFGNNMSPLDTLVYALGRSGDASTVSTILDKVALLDATVDFSHHRAVSLALERLRPPAAAPALAALLAKENMSGHALSNVGKAMDAHTKLDGSLTALAPRRNSLREIYLARALYRCGDHDGIGKRILETYLDDVRGHFARHAAAVLAGKK
ncbi:MAG: FAD-dependent oxidoreductase [Victivallales bacterium]|nr:FAD-dependent oxidoreductase [Victivallales bacterium]